MNATKKKCQEVQDEQLDADKDCQNAIEDDDQGEEAGSCSKSQSPEATEVQHTDVQGTEGSQILFSAASITPQPEQQSEVTQQCQWN